LQMFSKLFLSTPWFHDRSRAYPLLLFGWRFD
jgi:hypothetical protein